MAHKGKHYKLWFRRDWSVQLNNYEWAFPEAFEVTENIIRWDGHEIDALERVLGLNLSTGHDAKRLWRSDPVFGPGANFRWEMEVTDANYDEMKTFNFRLYRGATLVLDCIGPNDQGVNHYRRWTMRSPPEMIVITKDPRISILNGGSIDFNNVYYDVYDS